MFEICFSIVGLSIESQKCWDILNKKWSWLWLGVVYQNFETQEVAISFRLNYPATSFFNFVTCNGKKITRTGTQSEEKYISLKTKTNNRNNIFDLVKIAGKRRHALASKNQTGKNMTLEYRIWLYEFNFVHHPICQNFNEKTCCRNKKKEKFWKGKILFILLPRFLSCR